MREARSNKAMKLTRLSAAPGRQAFNAVAEGAASCPRLRETAGTASQLIAGVRRTHNGGPRRLGVIAFVVGLAAAAAGAEPQPPTDGQRSFEQLVRNLDAEADPTECPEVASVAPLPKIGVSHFRGRLVASITGGTKMAVSGATVWLLRFDGGLVHIFEAKTDSHGKFSFGPLPIGEYVLKSCAPGVAKVRGTVIIRRGAPAGDVLLTTREGT